MISGLATILLGARAEGGPTHEEGKPPKPTTFGRIVSVYMHPQVMVPVYTLLTDEGRLVDLHVNQISKVEPPASQGQGDGK